MYENESFKLAALNAESIVFNNVFVFPFYDLFNSVLGHGFSSHKSFGEGRTIP